MGRAAAQYLRAERREPALVGVPLVGLRDAARVEELLRPAAVRVRAVVRTRLDEADGAALVLGQAPGEDAAGRPASEHEHVVVRHVRSQPARPGMPQAVTWRKAVPGATMGRWQATH